MVGRRRGRSPNGFRSPRRLPHRRLRSPPPCRPRPPNFLLFLHPIHSHPPPRSPRGHVLFKTIPLTLGSVRLPIITQHKNSDDDHHLLPPNTANPFDQTRRITEEK